MDIWLEVLDPAWWAHIRAALAENRPLFSSTLLNTPLAGQKALFGPDGALVYQTPAFPAALFAPLQILSPQKTAMHTWGEYEVLVDPLLPRPRLIIIGGVHIAMPLCQMAALLGFEVHIIDPRRAFASPERFPQAAAIHQAYPDKALADLGLGDQTYLAILSHDPKIDDRALLAALPHQPAYIGVLSSRRSHQLRLDRLRAAGIRDEGLLAQIKTPIGLDIRAQSPAEIALAILAEVVALKNKI
jgi:xanthine dehydrogenase accessory factor